MLEEFRVAANGLGQHPQDHGWRDLYRLFAHGLTHSAPYLTATILANHRARPTLSATHLLTLLGIALKTTAPDPFRSIAADSPIDGRLGVLEEMLKDNKNGIAGIILTRQNSFTSARRFLIPQTLLSSYFAKQNGCEVRFADFGTGLGILPRQLNGVKQYASFANDLVWPDGIPAFRMIPLMTRHGVDKGPMPDLEWVRACYGESEYYSELYSELLWALNTPEVRNTNVGYREIDLLDFDAVAAFIHQHQINAVNLSYVLYELEGAKRLSIVEMLTRELRPPGVLIISEPHRELQTRGVVVEFFHHGSIEPQTLCFVSDGHCKGYVLPLDDYENFVREYPIEYQVVRG